MFAIELDVEICVYAIIIAPVNDTDPNGGGKRGGESATYSPALPKSHKGTMWEGGWSVDDYDGFPSQCLV